MKLDANNFSNAAGSPAPFKQNQFSAIRPSSVPKIYHGKNRTFFFGDTRHAPPHERFIEHSGYPAGGFPTG
jgi:hypothetical protein